MKKFILSIILFLLPICSMFIGLEFLLRGIPNDYQQKKQYLEENARSIEILFIGSSHAYYGIDPAYLEVRSFNASHISQDFYFDLKIIEKFRNDLVNMRTLVIPISYFSYFSSLQDEENGESWRLKNYSIYYNIETPFRVNNYSELLSIKFDSNIKRIFEYYLKGKDAVTSTALGYGTNYHSLDSKDLYRTGITAAERHTRSSHGFLEENYHNVVSIIEYCRSKKIKVLLFTPPAYQTYREKLNIAQLDLMYKLTYQLVEEYDNCYYVDYLYDTEFIAEDFYDADHLNEIGAKKLTMKIYNSIIEINK